MSGTVLRPQAPPPSLPSLAAELAALYAAAPVGLAVIDRALRFVRVNDLLAEINGVPAEAHVGRHVREVVPDLAAQAEAAMRRVLAGEALRGIEFTGETPARPGEVRTWRETWLPLRAEDGTILGATLSVEDITEEKAEQRRRDFLLRLEERLRGAGAEAALDAACALLGQEIGATFVGLSRVEDDGVHGVVENEWRAGDTPSLLRRRRLADFGEGRLGPLLRGETVVVEDARTDPRVADPAGYLSNASLASIDVPLMREGRMRALLFAADARPRRWTAEEVALVEETAARAWEAAERARAEAAMRVSEARFRQLAEAVREVFYVVELEDGRLSYVSPAYEAIWGRPVAELLADPSAFVASVHSEDRAAVAARQARLRAGEPVEGRYRVVRPDGTVRHVQDRVVLVADPATGRRRGIGLVTDVTEQRAVEERLQLATEAAGMGIFDVDLTTGAIAWDERLRALWGVGPEEVVTDAVFVAGVHPEDRALMRAAVARALDPAGDGLYRAEYRLHGPEGEPERWIAAAGRAYFCGGRPVRLIGTVRDVTARKRAEAALREAEERQRTLVAALSEIVWSTDAEGRTRPMEAWARLTGMSVEATAGHGWLEAVHPDDREEAACRLAIAAAEPGRRYVAEFRVRCADGSWRWFESRAVPLRDAEGRVREWLGVTLDIDERRRAEAAMAESEARFRTLANTLPALIFVADGVNGNSWVNEQFPRFAGLPAEGLLGRGWSAVLHPDDREAVLADAWRSWESGRLFERQIRFRRADGAWRWHLVRGTPVTGTDGRVTQWVGAAVDIQDLVEAREALAASRQAVERANAELERRVAERTASLAEANARLAAEIREREAAQAQLVQAQKLEALGSLTSGLAHDFNNVIAAIAGGFQVVERRAQDPRLIEVARHGARAAERGGLLVKQLLAFARQQVLAPRAVDLAALLAEAEPLIARSLGPGVALAVDCPEGLPPVRVDPVQLETALINLAVNARDAMEGEGRASLTARLSPAGDPGQPAEMEGRPAVALTFADEGCGMTPELLERVIEPFFTTKEPGRGTGLGLAMVHGFARQSGGALRIDSAPGEGTRVTLWLPLADGSEGAEAAPIQGAAAGPPAGTVVLLVDDDPAVRGVTAAQLQDLGCRVVEAADAVAALDRLRAEPRIALLLTDVAMPGGDGATLAEAARALRPGLPVLFMTGHADRRRLAGETVLDKPFAFEALARALGEALAPG